MPRFPEIDIARGLAVGVMILFHFLFDLNFFGIISIDLQSGILFWLARAAAFAFVFLAGLSCALHFHRKKDPPLLHRRGLIIFAWGLAITLVSFLTFPTYTIWFGALHLIGLGIFLSPFFIPHPRASGWLGAGLFLVGSILSLPPLSDIVPAWLGIFPFSFSTFDYFPLFPWMGVFLLGVWAGTRWFVGREIINTTIPPLFYPLIWAGRNSLVIYLIHQPILLGLIWGTGLVS